MTDKPLDLDAAQAFCDAATPPPWTYQEQSDTYTHIIRAIKRFICQFPQGSGAQGEANARFTAQARTGWPAALAEIRRLQALTDEMADGLVQCTGELERLRGVLSPKYDAKIAEPDREVIDHSNTILAKHKAGKGDGT